MSAYVGRLHLVAPPGPPVVPPPRWLVGLDLGQRHDWTAAAVVEQGRARAGAPACYAVRQLDRIRQESYPDVVDGVAALLARPALAGADLVVDETGVGAAVADLMAGRRLRPRRVTITAGSVPARDGARFTVPKRDLVSTVAVLLESRRLTVAEGLDLARTLIEELHNFTAKIGLAGHDTYGAADDWREGNHDDLVLAVALAVWFGEHGPSGRARSY